MIKKHYYSWQDVEKMCVSIVNQMYKDNWRPDYIVVHTILKWVNLKIIPNKKEKFLL